MADDATKPGGEEDEALSPEDLKQVAGGLQGPDDGTFGEAGVVGEAV